MKSLNQLIVAGLIALASSTAMAAGPFGLDVGKASLKQVEGKLAGEAEQTERTVNKWTRGPQLTYDGQGLGIDQLQAAVFIFNSDNVLVGTILDLPKSRYQAIKTYLSSKYKLVGDKEPYVGNRRATFRSGDVMITEDAPHMSFQMSVNYIDKELSQAYQHGADAEKKHKKKRETAQF